MPWATPHKGAVTSVQVHPETKVSRCSLAPAHPETKAAGQ